MALDLELLKLTQRKNPRQLGSISGNLESLKAGSLTALKLSLVCREKRPLRSEHKTFWFITLSPKPKCRHIDTIHLSPAYAHLSLPSHRHN